MTGRVAVDGLAGTMPGPEGMGKTDWDPIGMGIGDDRGGSDRAQHMSRQIRKMQSGEGCY